MKVMQSFVSHQSRIWLYSIGAMVLAFLVLPCLLVIPISFSASQFLEFPPRSWSIRWYQTFFSSQGWRDAALTSLGLSCATVVFATPIGIAAAYALRGLKTKRRMFANGLFMLPMTVPSILVAVGLFFLYSKVNLTNTFSGLLFADITLAIPFVVIAVSNGFDTYDFGQERAAQSLGATRLTAFFTVTLPQLRGSIFTGAVFAFVTAFDEAVVALFVSGGSNETLTRRIFQNIRDQIDPTVAAASVLLMVISISIILVTQLVKGARKKVV